MKVSASFRAVLVSLALIALAACSQGGNSTAPAIAISPAAMQYCDAGQSIPFNSTASVTWTLSGVGSLNSIAATGVTYSAPATVGSTTSVTLTASSNTGRSATVTIMVSPSPSITTKALPDGAFGTAYSATVAVSGGVAPIAWSNSAGLPPGLTFNSATGVISGTPTSNGVYHFTAVATDFSTPQLSASAALTITIGQPIAISNTVLLAGEYGIPYSATLAVTGGTKPYTWSIMAGSLPTGITLAPATGVLSGTPTGSGVYPVTFKVTDSSANSETVTAEFSLSIAEQLLISTATLPSVAINNSYSTTLAATGGVGAYTWKLASGSSLPTGLSLNSTGVIYGTPITAGTATFSVQATDAGNPPNAPQTSSRSFTLNVAPALSIATATLPSAAVGSAYTTTLASAGGTPPVAWSVANGTTLPTGLSLNASTGVLSGVPSAPGNFSLSIIASDSSSPIQSAARSIPLTISAPTPLTVTTTALPVANVGSVYSATLRATGGLAPLAWGIRSGSLPAGLSLNAATGLISGTPTAPGIVSFTAEVTDSETPTASATTQLTISVGGALGSGVNDAELSGSYVFLINGFTNGSSAGAVYGFAGIGVFTADGKGGLTGTEDTNGTSGVALQTPITGQYAVGPDNRGTLIINTGSALTTYAISVSSPVAGVSPTIHLTDFDDTATSGAAGSVATGIARLQTASAFTPSTLHGSFVFGLQGETPCNTCFSATKPFGPVSAAGVLTADGNGNLSGEQDAGAVGTAYSAVALGGSYTNPSSDTGRGTLSLSQTGNTYPAAPPDAIYYIVNANELLIMSSDSHADTTLLSGDLQLQQLAAYSASSLSGTFVGFETGSTGGDGTAVYPSSGVATLSLFNVTGTGAATLTQDSNSAGTFTTTAASAVTYTVAASGRTVITRLGNTTQVLYLFNTDAAYGVDMPQPSTNPGLIQSAQQTISASYPAYLTGSFAAGTMPPSVPETDASGVARFVPNTGGVNSGSYSGNVSFTLDTSGPAGTTVSGNISSYLSNESTSGRTTITDPTTGTLISVIYAISPTLAVQIQGTGFTPPLMLLTK